MPRNTLLDNKNRLTIRTVFIILHRFFSKKTLLQECFYFIGRYRKNTSPSTPVYQFHYITMFLAGVRLRQSSAYLFRLHSRRAYNVFRQNILVFLLEEKRMHSFIGEELPL